MKTAILCALLLLLPATAQAQGVPRIKARITAFDGKRVTIVSGKDAQTLSVGLLPGTRIMAEESLAQFDIKPGDYVGATISRIYGDRWQAREVHLFPAALKGSNEGLFALTAEPGKNAVAGTVRENAPGLLTLSFRGLGPKDGPTCIGHAPANPAEGCQGEIQIMVEMNARILTLKPADKSALVPGATVAISILAGSDGRPVTPGLTIQAAAPNENPATNAAKPASK